MAVFPRSRIVLYAAMTLAALSIDLGSKSAVFTRLGGLFRNTGWLIDGWLRFELHTSLNRGALWGMGQGMAPVFALLSVAALIGINYWLFIHGAAKSLLYAVQGGSR